LAHFNQVEQKFMVFLKHYQKEKNNYSIIKLKIDKYGRS
jgi:hypothetical protein